MARLPQPGSDNGTWGDILNEYLSQTLKADGTIKDNVVTSAAIAPDTITATEIQDGTITESQLGTAVQTKLNQSGDWNTLSNKPAVIAAGADQAAARSAIGAGTSNLQLGTTNITAKAGDYAPTKSDLGLGNVDNTSDTNKPISTAVQTALDGKAGVALSTVTSVETIGNAAATHYIVLLGSGAVPTLPTAVSNASLYTIKNIYTAANTILTTSSQTIEGQVGYVITANESITIVSDGTNWRII